MGWKCQTGCICIYTYSINWIFLKWIVFNDSLHHITALAGDLRLLVIKDWKLALGRLCLMHWNLIRFDWFKYFIMIVKEKLYGNLFSIPKLLYSFIKYSHEEAQALLFLISKIYDLGDVCFRITTKSIWAHFWRCEYKNSLNCTKFLNWRNNHHF